MNKREFTRGFSLLRTAYDCDLLSIPPNLLQLLGVAPCASRTPSI